MIVQIVVFLIMTTCSLVCGYRYFGGILCRHFQFFSMFSVGPECVPSLLPSPWVYRQLVVIYADTDVSKIHAAVIFSASLCFLPALIGFYHLSLPRGSSNFLAIHACLQEPNLFVTLHTWMLSAYKPTRCRKSEDHSFITAFLSVETLCHYQHSRTS